MALLDQSSILITGASSGLGAEFARQLAPRAKSLILAARRGDRLADLAQAIARPGLTVHCVTIDLCARTDVPAFFAEVRRLAPDLNVLINNAGLGDHGLFEKSNWSRVESMIELNIHALTWITHEFVRDLIARPSAGILNVSSIASFLPLPQMTVYAATKAYVTSFTEGLRAELRGTGVRVTALCPGPVDTEFFDIAERPGDAGKAPPPSSMKVPAQQVVREGLSAFERDRPRKVPGRLVSALMSLTSATPMLFKRMALNRRGRNFQGH